MRKFWLGVLAGALGMAIVCAALPLALNFFVGPRALASFERGDRPAPPPIVFRGLFGSRGDFGTIDELGDGTFIFRSRDGERKTVVLTAETVIYRGRTKVAAAELSMGQRLLVIGGRQSDGSILAKLIRFVSSSFENQGAPGEGRLK